MFKPVPIKLKRGEAVFHHPLAVHGSLENKYRAMVLIDGYCNNNGNDIGVNGSLAKKCRCGEGNDIDIGVLGILKTKYKSMHNAYGY